MRHHLKKIVTALTLAISSLITHGCAITPDKARYMANADLCDAVVNDFMSSDSKYTAERELMSRKYNCFEYYQQKAAISANRSAVLLGGAQYFNDMATQNQRLYLQNKPTNCVSSPLGNSIVTNCQ